MPGRQQPAFRLLIFGLPLVGGLVLLPYEDAKGFSVLVIYYALVAFFGVVVSIVGSHTENKQ